MSTLDQVDHAVELLGRNDLVLLPDVQCLSSVLQ